MKKIALILGLFIVSLLLFTACKPATVVPTPTAVAQDEPYKITGSFTVTNDFVIATYMVEHAVALVDMHGFVVRDFEWEIPVDSQVLGYMKVDVPNLSGTYELSLPERPLGTLNDVANDGSKSTGVQIFAVSYWPNLAGGPFSEGDDPSFGWPNYLASIKTDAGKDYEVTGGKLVIWAPDDKQSFPTDFGADGKLFTADDPVAPIKAGYSIVDLDQKPFAVTKELEPKITLYEPTEIALKDYSKDTYTQAFDKMFEFVRKHYAFNGIPGKEPDWDALYAELEPRVQQAETNKDAQAYYLALRDFTYAFKDGHVGLNGGDIQNQLFAQATAGGYGFAMRELDDGRFIVIFVRDPGPAKDAGMQVGAQITEFNGKSISDAVAEVKPLTLPQSTDWNIRYQQARYLLATDPGTKATVAFTNPGGRPQTATLTAIAEPDSYRRTSIYYGVNTAPLLPVEFKILDSGVGYVSINSYYDDLNLIIRLFERALRTFQAARVPGIIIDLRYNSGGNPLGLAGFLYDQEIPLGQGYSYSETTGKFEKEGPPNRLLPNVEQYRFDKMVLLVGPACASACDQEAYSFSKVPDMIVMGMFPSSGTFADVADGQFSLPEGFSLQVPTERFLLPDGSLFLEGTGVQPNLKVPITAENVISAEDVVLKAAEKAVLQPLGAGITPSAPPRLMTVDESRSALSTAKLLEQLAREQYTTEDKLKVPATFKYTISLSKSQPLLWVWGWCAKDQATLTDNLGKMKPAFTLNGEAVALDRFYKLDFPSQGRQCTAYVLGLTDWQGGENHVVTTLTFKVPVNDGTNEYPAGEQILDYWIYVKP